MLKACCNEFLDLLMSSSKKFTPSVLNGGNHAPSDPLDGLITHLSACLKKSITSIKI